ncbi:MAG: hypothetical protein JO301_18160 [Chitinophagaceae bacterium]|nr:hypothetical protein [Chitinophagaceae bacterium]
MRKKLSTLFLLLVLSIQALPVKQMGLALFSNQFTEELPHAFDTEKDCCKKSGFKSDFIETPMLALNNSQFDLPLLCHPTAAAIPQNHTGEIHVPPPNVCA